MDYFTLGTNSRGEKPLGFAIDGYLQEAGVALIGGLAGRQGKTLIMLSMVKSLLEETYTLRIQTFFRFTPCTTSLLLDSGEQHWSFLGAGQTVPVWNST